MSPVLNFDDLRRISRLGERATLARVEKWARTAGIRFLYDGSGGILTTVDAINSALGVGADAAPQMMSPDQVF